MAKKTDTTDTTNTKPAAPVAPAKPDALAKRAIKPAAAKTKPAPKSTAAKTVKAKRATKAPAAAKAAYTQHDVALRAYFISEKRRAHGLPGDEHQDWLEAERQIIAEGGKPKKAKKT